MLQVFSQAVRMSRMSTAPKALTARERARIEFTRDIKEAARRQLAEHGPAGLSLRGVARDIGLASASALYRYFPGRDALLTALIADAYDALGDAADAAAAATRAEPYLTRWTGVCHAVRAWALAHPHEYALIHGSPVPGYEAPPDTTAPGIRGGREVCPPCLACQVRQQPTGQRQRGSMILGSGQVAWAPVIKATSSLPVVRLPATATPPQDRCRRICSALRD